MTKICLNEGQKKSERKKKRKKKLRQREVRKCTNKKFKNNNVLGLPQKKSLCLEHVKELEFTEHIIMPLDV